MLKFVIIFSFFISLSFSSQAKGNQNQLTKPNLEKQKYEVRATWLTTLGGMDWPSQKATSPTGIRRQKKELCDILDQLKAANFNTILFQTRLRGDVIYPSYLEGYAECLTGKRGKNPGYDPLQFAIDECHKRGLALHAWIVTIPVGSKRQVRLLGRNSVVSKHPSLCKQFRGNWYLDPGEPGTADYLSNIVKEIVARYDVDGIHFDYLRYPEQGKRFPDYRSYRKYGKKQPLATWRRENITRIVRRLHTEIKALKPWVIVSSSPIGKFNDTKRYRSLGWNAYAEVHQDAQGWMKEGIHDALFPMMYFRDNHFYPFALDWQEHKNGRWIVPGLGVYFLNTKGREWKLSDVLQQIEFTRQYHLEGQAYFRNHFLLSNPKGIWNELTHHFYDNPAVTPPLTWIDSIAPNKPKLIEFTNIDSTVVLKWKAPSTQKAGGISFRVYASNTYPVDVESGRNIIATLVRDTLFSHTASLPWQKKLYWAVTAVDRYGNESDATHCNSPHNSDVPIYFHQLPEIPEGSTLIISDLAGYVRMRLKKGSLSLENSEAWQRLAKGNYRISIHQPDGTQKFIGLLVR